MLAKLLNPGDVDRLMTPQLIVGWVKRVLEAPEAVEAPRTSVEYKGSWLGAMVASGFGRHVVKIVGVYPQNPERGLSLIRGILLSIDSSTGEEVLRAPAEEPTGWRTAAASALALGLMGFKGGGVLGVIGAGVQARYHIEVLTSIYTFERLLVHSRTEAKARKLASRYGGRVADRVELLRSSDVVVAATTSQRPVVTRELKIGSWVVSVGAPKPVREIDDVVLARALCVVTDSPIAAQESDDAARAPRLVTLRSLITGREQCIQGDYRVYKSVGTPLLDLAAALALEDALKN